ncbi:MAG: hypothetical protein ABL982_11430 [Vicinamibacterales bacterium]
MRLETMQISRYTRTLVVCGLLSIAATLAAQAPQPVLVVLDRSGLDVGEAPHLVPSGTVNEAIAAVGLRESLPFFSARLGETVTLPGGGDGGDGWFVLRAVPAAWAPTEDVSGGLEDFFLAGAGLGSPDEAGDRTSLLRAVPDVVPLRTAGLSSLVGRRACIVVYGGDVNPPAGIGGNTDLSGTVLGVVALDVMGVQEGQSAWPTVTATVLDPQLLCRGALTAMPASPYAE